MRNAIITTAFSLACGLLSAAASGQVLLIGKLAQGGAGLFSAINWVPWPPVNTGTPSYSTYKWTRLPSNGEAHPSHVCLDCGAPDTYMDSVAFNYWLDSLSREKPFRDFSGRCFLQIVVDTLGRAFVVRYEGDLSASKVNALVKQVTAYNGWRPAYVEGRAAAVSFVGGFTWGGGRASFSISRVDWAAARENFNNPGQVDITNTRYKYRNNASKQYDFQIWVKANSAIPYDLGASITVDKSGVVWEGTFNGIARYYDDNIQVYNRDNAPFDAQSDRRLLVRAAATDSADNKWFSADYKIYEFDSQGKWRVFDSAQTGLARPLGILVSGDGQVICSGWKGFSIFDGVHWHFYKPADFPLPSAKVYFAQFDSKRRLWIGSFKGLVMTEGDKTVSCSDAASVLEGLTATAMTEDEQGNLWFAVRAYKNGYEGGLAELDASGKWTIYNTTNSGLPASHINALLFDRHDNALWLSVDNVGLVRYDRDKDWSLFTRENSGVPSSVIFAISEDRNGNIWGATGAGLLEVTKKQKGKREALWARP